MEELPIRLKNPEYYQDNRCLRDWEFQRAVSVYATNQDHFLEENDVEELLQLELWFLRVIEPMPEDDAELDDWLKRELAKKSGYTYSCLRAARKKFRIKDKAVFASSAEQIRETVRLFNARREVK